MCIENIYFRQFLEILFCFDNYLCKLAIDNKKNAVQYFILMKHHFGMMISMAFLGYAMYHSIIEQFGLEKTLKIILFQPPDTGRVANHYIKH